MMSLGDYSMHCKTDNVLSSLSVLFGINNQAIRVILFNAGNLKTQGNEHELHANGVESFKSYNEFDNNHLEASYFWTKGEANDDHYSRCTISLLTQMLLSAPHEQTLTVK